MFALAVAFPVLYIKGRYIQDRIYLIYTEDSGTHAGLFHQHQCLLFSSHRPSQIFQKLCNDDSSPTQFIQNSTSLFASLHDSLNKYFSIFLRKMACLIEHSVVFSFCKTKISAEKFNKTLILIRHAQAVYSYPVFSAQCHAKMHWDSEKPLAKMDLVL